MKTIYKILGTLMLIITFVGCSSVKVTDSWKGTNTSQIKNKSILVLSQTDDKVIRTQFETDIVEQLSKKGLKSIESYKMFPVLNPEKKLNNKELVTFKKELTDIGIDVVVMTVLKDIDEYIETTTNSGNVYHTNMYPSMYYRGYHRGFYRSFSTVYIDSSPITSTTYIGKNYILETLIYDLTKPEESQLLSVITSVVKNPETLGTTSEDFSRKIVNELVK